MSSPGALRVCVIGSNRFPVAEPFAGGAQAHTHALVRGLRQRGHHVSLFAAAGSDPALGVTDIPVAAFQEPRAGHHAHVSSEWLRDHQAYLALMLELAQHGADRFDVVHDVSQHHLPVTMARSTGVPMVTAVRAALPPELESALARSAGASQVVTTSDRSRDASSVTMRGDVVRTGADSDVWTLGDGGARAAWAGRISPDRAPHEAIDACRAAGVALRLAGPIVDVDYYRDEVRPRLDVDAVFLGHLHHRDVLRLLQSSSVALVTPLRGEPSGAVAVEAMSCGTPVAAYARGALPELVGPTAGALAAPGDVAGLTEAVLRARELPRAEVRRATTARFSVGRMLDGYEAQYARAIAEAGHAPAPGRPRR